MADFPEFTLAAIQAAPVYFDREASTEKACQLIEYAAQKGTALAAFGESWLPGYPFFKNSSLINQARVVYLANAVEIPGATTDRICKAAPESCIIAPGGDIIAEAPVNEETVLTVSVSLEAVLRAKAKIDVGGHYSRQDVLQLLVNRNPHGRIVETNPFGQSRHTDSATVAPQDLQAVNENEQEKGRP